MVLAKKKSINQRCSNEKDIAAVCESFMNDYGILARYNPSTVRRTTVMFRRVSAIIADVFEVPIYQLCENHFLNDAALGIFIEYIRTSGSCADLRPMVKKFYSYLFHNQIGEAFRYDPKYIEIQNMISSISKVGKSKKTTEKRTSNQVEEHPLFNEYIVYMMRKRKTKKLSERYTIRKFFRWYCDMRQVDYEKDLAKMDLSEINSHDIEQFVNYLMSLTKLDENDVRHIKVRTAALCLVRVRRFFKYLVQRGYISKNPLDSIEPIEEKRERNYRYITQEQCEDFLETVHRLSDDPITDMSMFQIAMYLGMRPSEVADLKVGNFDFENGEVRFIRAKSYKEEVLELPSFLIVWLENYMETHPASENTEAPMFFNYRKGPITYKVYWERYHNFRENMKNPIPKSMKGPHVFRHTFASMLLRNNTSLYKVAKILGHSSIYHTDAYLHSGELGVEKAVKDYFNILSDGEEKPNGNQTQDKH
jgi:integrase/recombinase XerC